MVGVKAAPRGGREIVPGHVRRADIDAPAGHDVLGVVHARMARISAPDSDGAERRSGPLALVESYRGEIHHAHAYGFTRVLDSADQPFLVPGPPRIEDLVRAAGEQDGPPLPAKFHGERRLPVAGALRRPAGQ